MGFPSYCRCLACLYLPPLCWTISFAPVLYFDLNVLVIRAHVTLAEGSGFAPYFSPFKGLFECGVSQYSKLIIVIKHSMLFVQRDTKIHVIPYYLKLVLFPGFHNQLACKSPPRNLWTSSHSSCAIALAFSPRSLRSKGGISLVKAWVMLFFPVNTPNRLYPCYLRSAVLHYNLWLGMYSCIYLTKIM